MTEKTNDTMRELKAEELEEVGGGWIFVRPGTKPPRFPAPPRGPNGLPQVY